MYCDYHIHSDHSFDCYLPMEDTVKEAIKTGLEEICFTDHVDYGRKIDRKGNESAEWLIEHKRELNVDYEKYFTEIETLQKKYAGQIVIRKGLELGVQVPYIPLYEEIVKRYPMDFILLSIHCIDNVPIYKRSSFEGTDHVEMHRKYYETMLECVRRFKDYSVLAHLDNINRYDPRKAVPFDAVRDLVGKILDEAIRDGKGIEVNSARERYGLTDLTPQREILKMYRDKGGKILSIGSDTHKLEHLALEIDYTKEELKKLGFDSICTWNKGQYTYHPL